MTARGAVTQAELARSVGRSKQFIGKLVAEGRINAGANGKISETQARRMMGWPPSGIVPQQSTANPGTGTNVTGSGGRSLTEVKIAHTVVQTRREALKLKAEQGELLDRSLVESGVTQAFAAARSRLLEIPGRCAPDLFAQASPEDLAEALDREIRRVLADLADSVEAQGGSVAAEPDVEPTPQPAATPTAKSAKTAPARKPAAKPTKAAPARKPAAKPTVKPTKAAPARKRPAKQAAAKKPAKTTPARKAATPAPAGKRQTKQAEDKST